MTSSAASAAEPQVRAKNPYVGPRAFRTGEALYARDFEMRELANLVVAERIVLLHAPSGAGKTSLIRAGVTPLLKQRRFRPTKPLRVNAEPPEGSVHNRYVYSTALGLLGRARPEGLARLDLCELVERAQHKNDKGFLVLVFDQFEEILTLDPTDWENQETFFSELGEALERYPVFALISMREDYIGGLERYRPYLPGNLNATYRLDFLEQGAAKEAIQAPARNGGVDFTDEAADELVRRLACMKIQRPGGKFDYVNSPYVLPVQLQVVCRELWKSVSKDKRADFRAIELEDVERHADIPKALRSYYAGVVADVAAATGAQEETIRNWFESQLITAERYRSQTVTGPMSGDVDPQNVLNALEMAYLIRSDVRAGSTWWELTHDMLIEPILSDNVERLELWQVAARKWGGDRKRAPVLYGTELREAQRRAQRLEPSQIEREFLEASVSAEKVRGRVKKLRDETTVARTFAIVELIIICAVLLWALSR